MLAALPKRLALAGLILPLALGACRSDDVTGVTPAPTRPALVTGLTFTVTNTNDDGPGSLRNALANTLDGDGIDFDPGIAGQTILLTTGELVVDNKKIEIAGTSAKGITISGGDVSRVFTVNATGNLTLSNVTITRGRVDQDLGGGIYNKGTLALDHSSISGNAAERGSGGAVANYGSLTIGNSTLSNNQAEAAGAVYTGPSGSTTLINTTVAGNRSDGTGRALVGSMILRNSIVAGNGAPTNPNCFAAGAPIVLDGVNISDDDSCGAAGAAMIVADPKLGPLADNGGPTKTLNLLPGSPAIDGATAGCTVTDDQRYMARPQGGGCDIGAVEFSDYVKVTLTVDPSESVNPKTGVAVVTGTLTCSAPATIPLDVKLSQTQKGRRVTTTVSASGLTNVDCGTSKRFWSVSMAPSSGAFVNSDGSVTAKSVNTEKFAIPASLTTPVKLYWGHK